MPAIPFSLPLILLVLVLVGAVSTAVYAWVVSRQRKEILLRADAGAATPVRSPLLAAPERSVLERIGEWLSERTPSAWAASEGVATKLVQAGFDNRSASVIYVTIRVAFGLLVPAAALAAAAGAPQRTLLTYVGLAALVGVVGPAAVLDRLVQIRQERIRHSVPDALDLLVVCVEAGVSLDAAILRVARDLSTAHPDLAAEMMIINRLVHAGVSREDALKGLWQRTGLEELRGLAASMIQSERWGTSIAKVLRVNAETLRRKRKQYAEKKAAQASLKMMAPLMLFLMPALFVVILGPAILKIGDSLK
jgi:tight adherence protein C